MSEELLAGARAGTVVELGNTASGNTPIAADFLLDLLTGRTDAQVHSRGLRLRGARITGEMNWDWQRLPVPLVSVVDPAFPGFPVFLSDQRDGRGEELLPLAIPLLIRVAPGGGHERVRHQGEHRRRAFVRADLSEPHGFIQHREPVDARARFPTCG